MERILTSQEREKLMKRHKKERDKRICDRIKAVLAYDDGYSYLEISRILLLDDETIGRYVEEFLEDKKLTPNHKGRQSKLTKAERQELIEHLKLNTYLYVKDICVHVKKHTQKNIPLAE